MKRTLLFAFLAYFALSAQANDQKDYPVDVEIISVRQVTVGSHTESTPLKCHTDIDPILGDEAKTTCTGGDTKTVADTATEVLARISDRNDEQYRITCTGWSCPKLSTGERHRARWTKPTELKLLFEKGGKAKEVPYTVTKVGTNPDSFATKATCRLSSIPDHANITVDGAFVGQTPADLKLTPGKHRIEVSVTGYRPFVQDLTAMPDSTVSLNANLDKL